MRNVGREQLYKQEVFQMENVRIFSDTVIHISPAIVAIAAIIALFQLRIAKNDIRTRSKREAVCLAAQKCETFAKEILGMYQTVFVGNQAATPLKKWDLADTNFSSESLAKPSEGKQWNDILRKQGFYVAGIDFLNRLEGFAMYFINGAADEAVAYPVVGSVFCIMVQQFSPLLIELRSNMVESTTSGPYQNTVGLYDMWSSRQTRKKLQQEVDELSARLNASTSTKIKPIGTE
jgi:hypothetical protein